MPAPKTRQILLIQGHPDVAHPHFGHALADAYARGAGVAGHTVERVEVGRLDFPVLRSPQDWERGETPTALVPVQQAILRADHLVLFFPLWLGGMPALLKAFLEQVARPGFAVDKDGPVAYRKRLSGRSARLVVTMGMPALIYRTVFRAHSVKALERNILGFVGIGPIHETLIGQVDGDPAKRDRWLQRLEKLGRQGD